MKGLVHIFWFWVFLFAVLVALIMAGCKRLSTGEYVPRISAGPKWSEDGYQLIMDFEAGGGKRYYEKRLSHPTWPGFRSGVTIGIGYDLGYHSRRRIYIDWHKLPFSQVARLAAMSGVTGQPARLLVPLVRDIHIPWKIALSVFHKYTIGRYWKLTRESFPGVEDLCADAQWACLSVIFNRGPSLEGSRRMELREIKEAVMFMDYAAMARANRASCRLWVGTDIERGMQRRRFAESALIERCL